MRLYSKVMKNWIFILLLFLICSCTTRSVRVSCYLSTLENIKNFSATGREAKTIDSLDMVSKEFQDKCQRENLNCTNDISEIWVEFKGGLGRFREVLFNNFKLPQNAKEGENHVRVNIGKNNNLEKIEILKYTDENTKKAIEDVFKLKELDNWSSAKIYSITVETEFEISIFIVKKLKLNQSYFSSGNIFNHKKLKK